MLCQSTRIAENEEEIKLDGMKIEKASKSRDAVSTLFFNTKELDLGSLLCESALNLEKKRKSYDSAVELNIHVCG